MASVEIESSEWAGEEKVVGRGAREAGIVALAAAGTLLALFLYQRMQRPAQDRSAEPPSREAAARPVAAAPGAAGGESKPAAPVAPAAEALAAARAVLGPDGEVLAYAEFPSAGGRQIVAVQRLPGSPGAGSAGGSGGAGAAGALPETGQEGETTAEVIRVSILVPAGSSWTEAFRAERHLKNKSGYLPGTPAEQVPAWHLACSKTPDDGFRLALTPMGLPSGKKPATVYAAWNAKRGEYDAVKAWGKGFLATTATPGGIPVPYKK